MIASGKPVVVVTDASATGYGGATGSVAGCTSALCTWSSHTHALGSGRPAAAATCWRLRTTATTSSPTWVPTLHESYGGGEMPPRRSLQKVSTRPSRAVMSEG